MNKTDQVSQLVMNKMVDKTSFNVVGLSAKHSKVEQPTVQDLETRIITPMIWFIGAEKFLIGMTTGTFSYFK